MILAHEIALGIRRQKKAGSLASAPQNKELGRSGKIKMYVHYLAAKLGITLHGRHAQICHLRDICIKWIWGSQALTAMSSMYFNQDLLII